MDNQNIARDRPPYFHSYVSFWEKRRKQKANITCRSRENHNIVETAHCIAIVMQASGKRAENKKLT